MLFFQTGAARRKNPYFRAANAKRAAVVGVSNALRIANAQRDDFAPPERGGVHPLALSFASRFDDRLSSLTLLIVDVQIHPTERFDHDLYWQLRPATTLLRPHSAASVIVGEVNGRRSSYPMGKYLNDKRTKGLVGGDLPGYSALLDGLLENRDTFVADRA